MITIAEKSVFEANLISHNSKPEGIDKAEIISICDDTGMSALLYAQPLHDIDIPEFARNASFAGKIIRIGSLSDIPEGHFMSQFNSNAWFNFHIVVFIIEGSVNFHIYRV